jgi:hypothetical protein
MGGIVAGAAAGGCFSGRSRLWVERIARSFRGVVRLVAEQFLVSLGEGAELRRRRRLGRVGRRRRRLLGFGMSAEQFVDPRAERHADASLLPCARRAQPPRAVRPAAARSMIGAVIVAASTVAVVAVAAAVIVVALVAWYVLPRGGRRKRPPRG